MGGLPLSPSQGGGMQINNNNFDIGTNEQKKGNLTLIRRGMLINTNHPYLSFEKKGIR